MGDDLVFASYPVFRALPERLAGLDRDVAVKEVAALFDDWAGRVEVRGAYSTAGFSATSDLMFWWVARTPDDVADLTSTFRKTALGRSLEQREAFLGLVRPAEFAPEHRPAFVEGKAPKKYLCVYPFVRTPEWYLLEPAERGALLKEHGAAAAAFKDVSANTTSAFGLGDFEWILAFEADSMDRIVDLIRTLRATEARRYTKVEVPFFTGIRKNLAAVVDDLPL
ncbi:MAG TPA: hydrogen peroxide-dependent heme synthase [Actinomycetota bacterium]|nr:hydrogen peroxide-dependent heme synthase [Actinomycetota bacterium]